MRPIQPRTASGGFFVNGGVFFSKMVDYQLELDVAHEGRWWPAEIGSHDRDLSLRRLWQASGSGDTDLIVGTRIVTAAQAVEHIALGAASLNI